MATFALTQAFPPKSGSVSPDADGLRHEIWRVTGDGSTTSATLTPTTIRTIVAVEGCGFTHNIAPPSAGNIAVSATATLTWGSAVGDGLYQDIRVTGLA